MRIEVENKRKLCEAEQEKTEMLEQQLRDALDTCQNLESQAQAQQVMYDGELTQARDALDSKCNDYQQVTLITVLYFVIKKRYMYSVQVLCVSHFSYMFSILFREWCPNGSVPTFLYHFM